MVDIKEWWGLWPIAKCLCHSPILTQKYTLSPGDLYDSSSKSSILRISCVQKTYNPKDQLQSVETGLMQRSSRNRSSARPGRTSPWMWQLLQLHTQGRCVHRASLFTGLLGRLTLRTITKIASHGNIGKSSFCLWSFVISVLSKSVFRDHLNVQYLFILWLVLLELSTFYGK